MKFSKSNLKVFNQLLESKGEEALKQELVNYLSADEYSVQPALMPLLIHYNIWLKTNWIDNPELMARCFINLIKFKLNSFKSV